MEIIANKKDKRKRKKVRKLRRLSKMFFLLNPSLTKDEFAQGINVGEYIKCNYSISGNLTDPFFKWYISNDEEGNNKILLDNTTKDSYFLNDTTKDRYISCEVILPYNSGNIIKKSNSIGPIGNIIGKPITQAMVGNQGFYYIENTGTYYLAEDIKVNNTAFVLNNEKITLNLNGYTVTYNNSPRVEIPNHSFEYGFSGWDLTNSPDVILGSGTPITNKVHDGMYSLGFDLPLKDQYIVNEKEIILEPNSRYSLSAMFLTHKSSGTLYVELSGINVPFNRRLSHSGDHWRGMQLKEAVFNTNTSGIKEKYKIKIGINSPSGSPKKSVYLDDIKIQKIYEYGVAITPLSWQSGLFPGIKKFATKAPNDILIKNGKIIQGQDKGTWSHNIYGYRGELSTIIDHVDCEVYGANSSNINIAWGPATISNSNLISRISAITSRDQMHGLMVGGNSFYGIIYNNTFIDGPAVGLRISSPDRPSKIYNNIFRMKNRYTNGYCISMSAPSGISEPVLIYNNKIENTGIYSGRGIHLGGGSSNISDFPITKIYNNNIKAQGLATIPEYGGAMLGGVYLIQIENGKGALVSGNDITAYGTDSAAWCVRYNREVSPLVIVKNNLKAVREGFIYAQHKGIYNVAGCLKPADHHAYYKFNAVDINNNTMLTNSTWVGSMNQVHGLQLSGNKLGIEGDYQKATWLEKEWGGKGSTGIRFIDNIYNDDLTRKNFELAKISNEFMTELSRDSSFKTSWSTEFNFLHENNPVENVSAKVFDNSGMLVYSGISNSFGKINILLDQFQWVGSSLPNPGTRQYNNYKIDANLGNLSGSKTFTVNNKQSINIELQ